MLLIIIITPIFICNLSEISRLFVQYNIYVTIYSDLYLSESQKKDMGACTSSKNKTDGYDNLNDLSKFVNTKSTKPVFSQESEALLNQIQKLTKIPPTKLFNVVLGDKTIKPTPRDQLILWSKQIPKQLTPNKYETRQYLNEIKDTFYECSLIELCDISRHLNNLIEHDIRVINLGAEIQRHFGCSDIGVLYSTLTLLNKFGFRFIIHQKYEKK